MFPRIQPSASRQIAVAAGEAIPSSSAHTLRLEDLLAGDDSVEEVEGCRHLAALEEGEVVHILNQERPAVAAAAEEGVGVYVEKTSRWCLNLRSEMEPPVVVRAVKLGANSAFTYALLERAESGKVAQAQFSRNRRR